MEVRLKIERQVWWFEVLDGFGVWVSSACRVGISISMVLQIALGLGFRVSGSILGRVAKSGITRPGIQESRKPTTRNLDPIQ